MIRIEGLESFCSEFGTSLNKAKAKLVEIGLENYYVYFAITSLIMPDVKNILELGTGLGESANALSRIFPNASIYTTDLPKSDKKHKKWRYFKHQGIERFNINIKKPNIKFIESDTFFLCSMELPKRFELILVDGGHCYPVVAWDTMFAYGHLARGGFMFIHDYISKQSTNDVKNIVDYFKDLIKEDIYLLPIDPRRLANEGKMVCIRKET